MDRHGHDAHLRRSLAMDVYDMSKRKKCKSCVKKNERIQEIKHKHRGLQEFASMLLAVLRENDIDPLEEHK